MGERMHEGSLFAIGPFCFFFADCQARSGCWCRDRRIMIAGQAEAERANGDIIVACVRTMRAGRSALVSVRSDRCRGAGSDPPADGRRGGGDRQEDLAQRRRRQARESAVWNAGEDFLLRDWSFHLVSGRRERSLRGKLSALLRHLGEDRALPAWLAGARGAPGAAARNSSPQATDPSCGNCAVCSAKPWPSRLDSSSRACRPRCR